MQGSNDVNSGQPRSKGVVLKIRRQYILQDALKYADVLLANGNSGMKDRIIVRYVCRSSVPNNIFYLDTLNV